jgi:hypothetical protein
MENNEQLPVTELKKFGIMTDDNKFSPKLSQQEIDNFLKGSTLVADDDKNRLTFKLADDKSSLEVNVYNKDIVNHKDLSSSELYEIATSSKSLYKAMADHGKIVEMGKTNFNQNPQNEMVSFVTVENERGKTVFYGNDLEEKLKAFKVGDAVQVSNVGIEKSTITANIDEELKQINKYNNVFNVEPLTDANQKTKSVLFQYDSESKTVKDLDTTELEFDTINGIKLTSSQIRDLKKGKEVKLDDDTTVELSPKSKEKSGLSSNTRMLLLTSLAFDGGLSFLIIKGVQKLNSMRLEHKQQQQTASFANGLENMKSVLESKISQSPNDQALKDKLKAVSKEITEDRETKTRAGKPIQEANNNSGVLIAKGDDHYLHDKNNEKNYYVTLLGSDNKERTIWGIDLKEKLADVKMFENIEIKYAGKKDVNVKVPIRDDDNKITAYEDKVVKRNSFDVNQHDLKLSQNVIDHFKENSEKLDQIKSFLLSKSTQYPEDKSIISSINIVDKYISSTNVTKQDENKNLQVVDYDTYEDANREKERKQVQEQEQGEERSTSKGRAR